MIDERLDIPTATRLVEGPAAGRPEAAPLSRTLAVLAVVVGAATVLASAVPASAVRLPAFLALAVLGPGAALVAHLRVRDRVVAWALVVLTSVTTFTALATAMVWARWWQPWAGAWILGGLVAAGGLAALARHRPAGAITLTAPAPGTLPRLVPLALGAALWIAAVATTDIADVGEFGLLGTVSPVWFAALAVCAGGFLAALRRPAVAAAHVALLVLILHGTTPLLLSEPQYAWTYPHLGVIAYFQDGAAPLSGDLYQQWPGVFAAMAQLSTLAGVPAADLAPWSPVAFNLAGSLLLWAVARSLTSDGRVALLTVFVFQCVNWVEQDYLSPQGLAFLLSLGVMLLAIRYLRGDARGPARDAAVAGVIAVYAVLTVTHQLSPYLVLAQLGVLAAARLIRPWWMVAALAVVAGAYLVPRWGLVSGGFDLFDGFDIFANARGNGPAWGSTGQAFSAVVVRVLAIGTWLLTAAVVVAAWRSRRREALLPAILAITPFLLLFGQSYGGEAVYRVFLFSAPWCAYLIAGSAVRLADRKFGSTAHFADRFGSTARLADREEAAHLADREVGSTARLADREVASAAHLADRKGASAVRLAGGKFGTAVRRLPAVDGTSARWAGSLVAAGVLLVLAALGTVQGRHGQLMVDRQRPADVAAAEYVYTHGRPGATVAVVSSNFPGRLTADYPEFNRTIPVGQPDLAIGADLHGSSLGPADLPAIESYLASFDGTTTYLVVSDGMRDQARYFGYFPSGALDRLESTLDAAPGWSVFHEAEGVTVYEFAGA